MVEQSLLTYERMLPGAPLSPVMGSNSLMQSEKRVSGAEQTLAFLPDTVLPADHLETICTKDHLQPEKQLMLAVLEDAVACFQRHIFAHKGREKALFREAEDWILEKGGIWLFSFENICDTLDINPDYLRDGLIKWKQSKPKGSLDDKMNAPVVSG